jgi:hypothetical protein
MVVMCATYNDLHTIVLPHSNAGVCGSQINTNSGGSLAHGCRVLFTIQKTILNDAMRSCLQRD